VRRGARHSKLSQLQKGGVHAVSAGISVYRSVGGEGHTRTLELRFEASKGYRQTMQNYRFAYEASSNECDDELRVGSSKSNCVGSPDLSLLVSLSVSLSVSSLKRVE
jgi:hypothetical protein